MAAQPEWKLLAQASSMCELCHLWSSLSLSAFACTQSISSGCHRGPSCWKTSQLAVSPCSSYSSLSFFKRFASCFWSAQRSLETWREIIEKMWWKQSKIRWEGKNLGFIDRNLGKRWRKIGIIAWNLHSPWRSIACQVSINEAKKSRRMGEALNQSQSVIAKNGVA